MGFLQKILSKIKKKMSDKIVTANPMIAQAMYNHDENRNMQLHKIVTKYNYPIVNAQKKYISVIYNYFKKSDTLFRSLDALQNQKWQYCSPKDIEIIIIDDGSPGESIAETLPKNIQYLWQRKFGYGICRAKNTGAKLANGRYLVFLDPDILVSSAYLDNMLMEFQKYGDNLVQCGYIWDYHFVGCPDPRLEFGVWESPNRLTRRFYQLAGGNMAISRNLYFQTPGFDEELIYGGVEDLLFGYHIEKIPGTSILFNRQMESWHIPHPPSGAHADPQKSWDIVRQKWPEFHQKYVIEGLR